MSEDNTANDSFEEKNENEVVYDDEIKMEIILDSDESSIDNFIDQNENHEDENIIKEESTKKEAETTNNGNNEANETPKDEDVLINNKTKIGEEYNFKKNNISKKEIQKNIFNKNEEKKENPQVKRQSCGKCFLYFISFFGLIIAVVSGIVYHEKINERYINFKKLLTKKNVEENVNKKNEIIIGIDFGSTQSGYQIFYNSEIMLEGNENSKIIPTELIFDNYFQKGLSIGQQAKYFPKENIEKENKLYFSKFKRNLDPRIKNNMADASIPIGKQLENDIVQNQYSYSEAEKLQKAQKIIELKSDLQRAQKTFDLLNPNNENLKNNITMINSKIQEIETNRITKMENDIMTKIGDTDPTPALKKNIEYIMKQIEKDNKIIEMLNNGNKAINPDVGTAEDILKQTLGNGTAGAPPVY